jgi:hypothetical protein
MLTNYHGLLPPMGITLEPEIRDRLPYPPRPLERKFPPDPRKKENRNQNVHLLIYNSDLDTADTKQKFQ